MDFTLTDVDTLSRKIPIICKVSPNSPYHVEDVNRAGGIIAILGELARAGLIDTTVKRVDAPSLQAILDVNDIMRPTATQDAHELYLSAPAATGRNLMMASQETLYPNEDHDRVKGCIRDTAHSYSKDGAWRFYSGTSPVTGL